MCNLWLFARVKHQNTDPNADEHIIKYTTSKLWPCRPIQASLAMLLGGQAQIVQVRPPKCSNDMLNMHIQLCGINSILWWATGEHCWQQQRVCWISSKFITKNDYSCTAQMPTGKIKSQVHSGSSTWDSCSHQGSVAIKLIPKCVNLV